MQLQNKSKKLMVIPTQVGPRKIVRFVWSAILDRRTCPLCRSLDGKVIDASDKRFSTFHPPIHQNCRCIWIGICQDDPYIPPIDWPPISSDLLQFATLKSFLREPKEEKEKPTYKTTENSITFKLTKREQLKKRLLRVKK